MKHDNAKQIKQRSETESEDRSEEGLAEELAGFEQHQERRGEGGLETKLEVTQDELFTSFDEQDAQKREEEEKGVLLTSSPGMLNTDMESVKMAGSSDWSGRGSRSRGSSTMSTSSGGRLDELKIMIQSLYMAVQNSNDLGQILRSEQAATRSEQLSLSVAVQSSRNEPAATANVGRHLLSP